MDILYGPGSHELRKWKRCGLYFSRRGIFSGDWWGTFFVSINGITP